MMPLSRPRAAAVRARRWTSTPWRYFLSSPREYIGISCLVISQVVIVYLLLDYVGRSNPVDNDYQYNHPCAQQQQRQQQQGERIWNDRPKRRNLYVKASENQARCVPQTISPGRCSDDAGGLQRPQEIRRETCAFDLEENDVVFGVWHSLATEARLQPLLDTWGTRAQIVLLASSVGVRESKLFEEGVPGSRPHLLGEP